jgi:hypothetical protein
MNEDAGGDRLVRNLLIGAAVVVVFFLIALLVALGFGLQWYLSPKTDLTIVQRRNLVQGMASAGQALAVFLTGAVGLIGLFFTWQNTSQARKSTQQTLELTRRGQITERFTQAIDQLGSKSLEIKLGGIYSLERTAYEDQHHHWPIMEVLTTYVRQHAPRKLEEESSENPKPDIQAILNVIGRRSKYHRGVEYGSIELPDTNLRGADLRGAYLKAADFAGADLRNASLAGADLQEAMFEDANLRGAYLGAADLRKVYFMGTDLQDAVLDEADLRTADLSRATGLTQEQLDNALGDSHTIVPHDLQWPAHWRLGIDEQRTRYRQLFQEMIESVDAERLPDKLSREDE